MRILITGGAGFIGSNFIRYVLKHSKNNTIINLDKLTYAGNLLNLEGLEENPNYKFIHGDICDRKLVEKLFNEHEIDTVINFAAESHVDRSIIEPDSFIMTNIYGTFILLDTARKFWTEYNNKKFLHVSTDEVYGSLDNTGLFVETTPYDPSSPYSASKASSDHIVRAYNRTYGLPVNITNCSNNYGPYQFPEKLIPLTIDRILNRQKIPVYGKGENVRDWLYVEDHCSAIWTVCQNDKNGQTYNIGGNNEKMNIEVVKTLCRITDELTGLENSENLIEFVKDRPGHDMRYAIDASKIKNDLGWTPAHKFDQGIRKTVEWYLSNKEWIRKVQSGEYREYFKKQYGMTL